MFKLTNARVGARSRRALLQAATACVFPLPALAGAGDPALVVAQRWSGLEIEQRRLTLEWQNVETWLFRRRDWQKLSDAERAAVPEAAQLGVIEDQLAIIAKTYDALLPLLKTTAATTRAGVLARFEALLWFLDSTDHPDARALLESCQRDLRRLWV
jgi:hypothetical protein